MQYIFQLVKLDVNYDVVETGAFYGSKERAKFAIEKESESCKKFIKDMEIEDCKLHPWQECKMQDGSRKCATIIKSVKYRGAKEYFGFVTFSVL